MISATRKRGALRNSLVLLLVAYVAPLAAAEVRLLHADAAKLHGTEQAAGADGVLQVGFEADGRVHALQLRPNRTLGVLAERLAGRAQAYAGSVGGFAGSWAAVTRIGNRWSGIWYDGGEYFGVDSAATLATASNEAAALPADTPVVYRLRDLVWEDLALEDDTLPVTRTGEQLATQLGIVPLQPGAPTRQLELGLVADAQLAARDGAAVEANLLARLNMVDGLFSNQLGVHITADSVTVFSAEDDEPFSGTTNASTLLGEIAAWRVTTPAQRGTGLTFVFTGRNLQGRTVGMAYMDALCSRRYAAALSQATAAVPFSALIAAHEIGHAFGAPHDGEAGSACAASPEDFIMAPRINGSQHFSSCSLEQMAARALAAACLNPVPPPDPSPGMGGQSPSQKGGGGAPDGIALALLLALALARLQMRANQSPR